MDVLAGQGIPIQPNLGRNDPPRVVTSMGPGLAEEEVVPDDGDPDYIDESEPKKKPEPKTPIPLPMLTTALLACIWLWLYGW